MSLVLSTTSIMTCIAQQYEGVQVKKIKGSSFKPELNLIDYHEFSLSVNYPRSMNFPGDKFWYRTVPSDIYFKMEIPPIQVGYSYNWQRWRINVNMVYEQVIVAATNKQYSSNLHVDQYSYYFGIAYKWMIKEKVQLYSGVQMGTALRKVNRNGNNYNLDFLQEGLGSIQIIALGISYKFSKFGLFSEFGYGTKGLANAGFYYCI